MSGKIGGSQQKTEAEQTRRLDPRLDVGAAELLGGSRELFQQGTGGIFQGGRLAEQDPLTLQAQQAALEAGRGLQPAIAQQQEAFRGLLGAGNINDPLIQRQLADLADVVGEQFGRTVLPQIGQGGTQAGQFGSSRQGIAEGLAAGEAARAISRGATQALLGGQQVGLQAQQLAPQAFGTAFLPSDVVSQVGAQRGTRAQQELLDQIQQFEAPRRAQLESLQQFASLLQSNPLLAAGTVTGKTKATEFGAEIGFGKTGGEK